MADVTTHPEDAMTREQALATFDDFSARGVTLAEDEVDAAFDKWMESSQPTNPRAMFHAGVSWALRAAARAKSNEKGGAR